ncbi:MAG TPA: hypothetical protein DEO32_04630, partial [Ruminococcaceae bacterium]|nr:hypothetical protein [Oscillospiraceae bacterium]
MKKFTPLVVITAVAAVAAAAAKITLLMREKSKNGDALSDITDSNRDKKRDIITVEANEVTSTEKPSDISADDIVVKAVEDTAGVEAPVEE